MADATNRGGASIEVMGRRSDGMGHILVLGSDHASSPHSMQDSNRNVPEQPSCHWQNGSVVGAASVGRQYQETLCLVGMPGGDAEMPPQGPQPNGSIQRLNDEHGDEKTSSLQQPATDPLASIFLDPKSTTELFDQFIDLETRYEQRNSRGPSPLQSHRSLNNSLTSGLHN